MPIDLIEVQGVRGIRERITIKPLGRSLLVHGDNGTGKSSIEKALRWALTGDGAPNDDASFTTEDSYRRHVSVSVDFPLATVAFTDGSTIAITTKDLKVSGNASAIRDACRLAPPFLRRSELLNVLSSRPADRFNYLESFLGLELPDEALAGLGETKAAIERRCITLDSKLETGINALAALLPDRPKGIASISALLGAAKAAAVAKGIKESDKWEDMAAATRQAADLGKMGELEKRRGLVTDFMSRCEKLSLNSPWSNCAPLEPLRAEATKALDASVDAPLHDILTHALIHFSHTEGSLCPVCQSQVDWHATRATIEARVRGLQQYSEAIRAIDKASECWLHALNQMSQLMIDMEQSLPEVAATIDQSAFIEASTSIMSGATAREKAAKVKTDGLQSKLSSLVTNCVKVLDTSLSALPLQEHLPELQLLTEFANRFAADRPALELMTLEVRDLRTEQTLLHLVYDSLRAARQDVAKATLKAIGNTVGKYYSAIHPPDGADEATGAPSIDIQRHGKGTAYLRGAFVGKEVRDPQWVYSDGHLDTVGICIFLALRRSRAATKNDPRLLVLDDIVLSIDLGHARRLIKLLVDEFNDHQLIMFTHNGLFAQWCTSLIPSLARVQIKDWSLEKGPHLGEYLGALEKLKASLADGTAKDIALRIMEVLDEWMSEARYAYQLAVPAQYGDQYTLDSIWGPFQKTIKEIGKALGSDLGTAVKELDLLKDLPRIRNYKAAHENEFAKEFPREAMVDIASAVIRLVESLYCRECLSFVIPLPTKSDPSMMHCPKDHIQYIKPKPAPAKPGNKH